MLVSRPAVVVFGGKKWESVSWIAIESSSVEFVEQWDDEGPNLMFADSTRKRTSVRVSQDIEGDSLDDPELGDEASFVIEVDRGNDADRKTISMSAVVQDVSYSFSGSRSTRLVKMVAVSNAGDIDPVSVIGGG
ncbi:MAG: hypothetical protein AB8C13_08845 [Phycisphaerales bacterium]